MSESFHQFAKRFTELVDSFKDCRDPETRKQLLSQVRAMAKESNSLPKTLDGDRQSVLAEVTFEIFAGIPDRDAAWLRTVVGLDAARERMEQIAAELPGCYFIFHAPSRNVLAQINNEPLKKTQDEPPKTATG